MRSSPRVAAIQDLSCVGRCSLTVSLPVLSAMGAQVIPLPTALLSTQTDGFDDLYFRDLTPDFSAISDHLSRIGMTFRAIYTGFLGSAPQIRAVEDFLLRFSALPDESFSRPLLLVDPVMGDGGKLYSTYTDSLAEGICRLAERADLITPNLTEACILSGIPYRETKGMGREEALAFLRSILSSLSASFPARAVVITGASVEKSIVNLGYAPENPDFFLIERPDCGHSYPGSGDLFASVLLGSILAGKDFAEACAVAADFVADVIRASASVDSPARFGLSFESKLSALLNA